MNYQTQVLEYLKNNPNKYYTIKQLEKKLGMKSYKITRIIYGLRKYYHEIEHGENKVTVKNGNIKYERTYGAWKWKGKR